MTLCLAANIFMFIHLLPPKSFRSFNQESLERIKFENIFAKRERERVASTLVVAVEMSATSDTKI